MAAKLKVISLISGRGSNFKSLLDNAQDFEIIGVISNNPDAKGLEFASERGIYKKAFDRKNFPSLKALKRAVLEEAKRLAPDLVTLAGFMQVLEPEFIAAFPGRIINIHPSLLPKFPGLDTHKRALEAKEKLHGCTVHVVDAGVDTGPIIAQAIVEVKPNDSEESLAARVLEQEHKIYAWVLNNIAKGEISITASGVSHSEKTRHEAKNFGFKI